MSKYNSDVLLLFFIVSTVQLWSYRTQVSSYSFCLVMRIKNTVVIAKLALLLNRKNFAVAFESDILLDQLVWLTTIMFADYPNLLLVSS